MTNEEVHGDNSSFVIRHSSFRNALTPISIVILALSLGCGRRAGESPASEGYWWPEEPISAAARRQEIETKMDRVREFLRDEAIGGLLVGREDDFAWLSAGGDSGGRALMFLRDDGRRFLIAGEDQTKRLLAEDLSGLACEAKVVPWYQGGEEAPPVQAAVAEASGGRAFGSDIPYGDTRRVEPGMRRLRSPLTESEITKYRWLGKTCAQAINDVSRRLRPGMTERGIEAMILSALAGRAVHAVEIRVATDGRASQFPEAPPSDGAKLERFVRIGIRARRWGMDVALTRCVQFGKLPGEARQAMEAAAGVCAGCWARTLPGADAGAVLQGAIADYAAAGFPGEWRLRDQGGAIGYGGWDWIAVPGSRERLLDGQTFSWHPEVRGVRMEDTILLIGGGLEVLTQIDGWPTVEARSLGHLYRLPAILVR